MQQTRLEYSQTQGSFHFDDDPKAKRKDSNSYFTINEGIEWDSAREFIELMHQKFPVLKEGAASWTTHPSLEEIKKEFALFRLSKSPNKENTITVGDLREELAIFPDDYKLDFGGLEFYRTKLRGDKLVHIEFSQNVYRDSEGNLHVTE